MIKIETVCLLDNFSLKSKNYFKCSIITELFNCVL